MKRLSWLLASALPLSMLGCDPGMIIRQTDSRHAAQTTGSPPPRASIDVKTSHPLIGETWYAPEAAVGNGSDEPIVVLRAELATAHGILANRPRQPGSYPLEIPAGYKKSLDLWFDLGAPVQEAFRNSVELRVRYKSRKTGDEELTAHAALEAEAAAADGGGGEKD